MEISKITFHICLFHITSRLQQNLVSFECERKLGTLRLIKLKNGMCDICYVKNVALCHVILTITKRDITNDDSLTRIHFIPCFFCHFKKVYYCIKMCIGIAFRLGATSNIETSFIHFQCNLKITNNFYSLSVFFRTLVLVYHN